jgi:hypothetical protein
MDNLETKMDSNNKNNLGDDIINDLQQIINYINKNILIISILYLNLFSNL